jgi:hypothetical protein
LIAGAEDTRPQASPATLEAEKRLAQLAHDGAAARQALPESADFRRGRQLPSVPRERRDRRLDRPRPPASHGVFDRARRRVLAEGNMTLAKIGASGGFTSPLAQCGGTDHLPSRRATRPLGSARPRAGRGHQRIMTLWPGPRSPAPPCEMTKR